MADKSLIARAGPWSTITKARCCLERFGDFGYATALFSGERLDGDASNSFLSRAGYQKYYDFATDVQGRDVKSNSIHSWGAREEYTLGRIEQWLTSERPADRPFYLEYMNAATHHPYGAPPGFSTIRPSSGKEGGKHDDYLNALNYTDHAIGALLDFLNEKGLLENTIIAVTGDHGEAFADIHTDNFLHRDFVYDENVRDYLLLSDGATLKQESESPIRSSRIGSTGDIMPSLLAVLGAPAPDVQAATCSPRITRNGRCTSTSRLLLTGGDYGMAVGSIWRTSGPNLPNCMT